MDKSQLHVGGCEEVENKGLRPAVMMRLGSLFIPNAAISNLRGFVCVCVCVCEREREKQTLSHSFSPPRNARFPDE